MKRIPVFLISALVVADIMAQIPDNHRLEDSQYCDYVRKDLSLEYHTNSVPLTAGWRYDTDFSDEFSGTTINTTKWNVANHYYHPNNPHMGYMNLPQNIYISSDTLFLNVEANDSHVVCYEYGANISNSVVPYLISGGITTTNTFQFGYVETECYLPKNHHYWPCFWGTNRISDYYDEVDVFERTRGSGTDYPNVIRQNCYEGSNTTHPSFATQILTFPDSITGRPFVFGAEILPKEVVFYINGHVTSHLKFHEEEAWANSWNTFTCTDIEEMIPMKFKLTLNCDSCCIRIPQPHEPAWFNYARFYKLERGSLNTYHPTIFTPSAESTKVYPHVILGGEGCTATVNTPTAVWAEQDIVLEKGFVVTEGTSFSARVIQVPDPQNSPLYVNNIQQHEQP